MNNFTRTLACLVLVSAVPALADNLLYKGWAKFKPGTSVKTHQADDEGGFKQSVDSTYTLLSVTPDQCVVKRESIVHSEATYKDEDELSIPRVVSPSDDPTSKALADYANTSMEDVTVPAGKFKANLVHYSGGGGGTNTDIKSWISLDVPGGVVKTVQTTTGTQPVKSIIEVVEISKK